MSEKILRFVAGLRLDAEQSVALADKLNNMLTPAVLALDSAPMRADVKRDIRESLDAIKMLARAMVQAGK